MIKYVRSSLHSNTRSARETQEYRNASSYISAKQNHRLVRVGWYQCIIAYVIHLHECTYYMPDTESNHMTLSLVNEFTSYALAKCLLRRCDHMTTPCAAQFFTGSKYTCHVIAQMSWRRQLIALKTCASKQSFVLQHWCTLHTSCHHVRRWQPAPTTANYNTDQLILP